MVGKQEPVKHGPVEPVAGARPLSAYYAVKDGRFVIYVDFADGVTRQTDTCDEVALALSEEGRLLQHGPRDVIEDWARGKKDVSIAVFRPGFSTEKLNEAIDNWFTAKKIIEEALQEPALLTVQDGGKKEE